MVSTEVVSLKQDQRTIDDRVATMWRRVQETERKPRQVLAFLLKVVSSRDRLHLLIGDVVAPDDGFTSSGTVEPRTAVGGDKRARLLLDVRRRGCRARCGGDDTGGEDVALCPRA